MSAASGGPDCFRCRSFYVTHDAAQPHGCRTFGFKSVRLPALEVRLTTGRDCPAYEPREQERPEPRRPKK